MAERWCVSQALWIIVKLKLRSLATNGDGYGLLRRIEGRLREKTCRTEKPHQELVRRVEEGL